MAARQCEPVSYNWSSLGEDYRVGEAMDAGN